jgi:two-component system sensor histidine kinase UhpB
MIFKEMRISLLNWKNWSVKTRLMVIATFPVIYLFFSVVSYSYYSHGLEAKQELAERGQMISTAMAEGLEFPLLNGNTNGLKQMLNGVVQSDLSIYQIDVFNIKKEKISYAITNSKGKPENRYFEKPIKRQMVWVNLLDQDEINSKVKNTSISNSINLKTGKHNGEIIGYVRVTMSPTHMVDKQKHRFLIELLISILALAVSAWVGRFLSHSLTEPLKQSIDVLRKMSVGYAQQKMIISTGGEIGELQKSINDMAENLHLSTQNLENKVEERTKELMLSRNEALKADAEKRKLIQKVNTIVEEERQSIAIEIHDELNASLIAVRLESERIARIASKAQAHPEFDSIFLEIQERAKAVVKLALNLYANGRNLVRRLRPEVLDMLGLHGAVEEMVKIYNDAQSDCHFHFTSEGDFSRIDKNIALSSYRIIQEASANVLKHAKAHHVEIHLSVDNLETQLFIEINDDGQGFDQEKIVSGIGIVGMRERVTAFGGLMQLKTNVGHGSRISISIPFKCVSGDRLM